MRFSRFFITTVEPLSNDHPHQRPSLLYDHILCDGQCFLFARSLTDDNPSDATNDQSDGIFSLANDHLAYNVFPRIAVQHPFPMVDYYNVVPKNLSSILLFGRRRYNDVLRATLHRYDVSSPPALSHIRSRHNSSALNKPHPGSSYYQLPTAVQHDVLCKMLREHTV